MASGHENHPVRSLPLFPALKPSFNEEDVSDKPTWLNQWPQLTSCPAGGTCDISALTAKYQDRLASMIAVDDMIGDIVHALELRGELDRSWLVFTSDNGYLHGEHRLPEKTYAFEEAIRVPLFVRPPGTTGSWSTERIALNIDLAPTFASIAGASMMHTVDGRSLLPVIQDPGIDWRKRFLIEHWSVGEGTNRFETPTYAALRTDASLGTINSRVFVEYDLSTPEYEHYDLTIDPFQTMSLHAVDTQSRVVERWILQRFLSELRACAGTRCIDLEDY